jgi:hypothetical protein
MKKVIRLTESDLENIVKRTINEMEENTLYKDIKKLIRDSISGREEVISILRGIADEMESGGRMSDNIRKRFRGDM